MDKPQTKIFVRPYVYRVHSTKQETLMSETQLQSPITKEASPSLTWEEIKQRYPDQHVLLIDYESDTRRPYPERAVVFAHSTSRKELWRIAKESPACKSCGVYATGTHKVDLPFIPEKWK
jgi:hypothetical protein